MLTLVVAVEPVEVIEEIEPPSQAQLVLQYTRSASASTAAAIEAIENVRNSTAHYIAAKRVALGIEGDPDVRAAFWLQEQLKKLLFFYEKVTILNYENFCNLIFVLGPFFNLMKI